MRKFFKKFDYRHLIAIAIVIASLLCSVLLYSKVFTRTIETLVDLFHSLKFYFVSLFNPNNELSVSVGNVSSLPAEQIIPLEWESFKITFVRWFQALFDGANFNAFMIKMTDVLLIFTTVLQLVIMLFLLVKILVKNNIQTQNNEYNQDTKALKRYKKIEKFFYPVKLWFVNFFSFFKGNRKIKYSTIFLIVWVYNLNLFTILGEALAFLFYFVSSLDFSIIWTQVYKLVLDLALMFGSLPFVCWLLLTVIFICKWRIKKGFKNLNHMQAMNCGFVKSLGTATLISSEMNLGKTKFMTSLATTNTTVFKETAKESLFKADFKFPNFPFINFERKLIKLINNHYIYSLATIERYIKRLEKHFTLSLVHPGCFEHQSSARKILFDYDFEEHGLYYNNGMYLESIFDVLDTYAKAYYVYILECSFGVSNYAIREDNVLESLGNFPLWDFDFFSRRPEELEDVSYYTKILDFDILRKGKKVVPLNKLADTFEFGTIVITELDKERGNSLDTQELKKNVDIANQKNDLFNYSLKMGRHPSTIDYVPYVKFFFDLQREMKVDADLREVCGEIITISETRKDELAMPCFFIEEFIYGLIIPKFKSTYEEYRFFHGNNTLFMYLLKKLCVPFYNYYQKIYNKFGYDISMLDITNGRMTYAPVKKAYYIMRKKDLAKRYSTDSHSGFYRASALKRKYGLIDYPSYSSERATLKELERQNSYFIMDMMNVERVPKKEDKKR